MAPKPRIYVSTPVDANLSKDQLNFKKKILLQLANDGLDPQEFHVSGIPAQKSWSFQRAVDLMRRCHGALILGFAQWQDMTPNPSVIMPTEYNHFEGALGIAFQKEMLIIKEEAVSYRGVMFSGGGEFVLSIPQNAGSSWLKS